MPFFYGCGGGQLPRCCLSPAAVPEGSILYSIINKFPGDHIYSSNTPNTLPPAPLLFFCCCSVIYFSCHPASLGGNVVPECVQLDGCLSVKETPPARLTLPSPFVAKNRREERGMARERGEDEEQERE